MIDQKIRNIGIFAHVDAGKTNLSEQLLLRAGVIRQAGSVDRGTAHTDDLPVERRRGISVRATCVSLSWRGTDIQLIDTPGHMDFSAEIERSFWALDAGVLVVDAALTGGRGSMFTSLHGYAPCPDSVRAEMPRRGVDPLDTAKYILAARSALEGNIYD